MSRLRIIRSRAPLRLGLAGGGTDISPYSDKYGGCVLNATISMFAYATIEPRNDGKIVMESIDLNERFETKSKKKLEIDGHLSLLKGTYNRIVEDFSNRSLSFKLTTYSDAPPGTGLGSSSTLVVAIVGAFSEWLTLPLGPYDVAYLSYEIERVDLGLIGGKQDQYSATFGGVNFMEFYADDKVIVNPLRVDSGTIRELEINLVLYYLGVSRHSSEIIKDQYNLDGISDNHALDAMHRLKEIAVEMKESILTSNLGSFGKLMDLGWQSKKQTSPLISNERIDQIYQTATRAGSLGGKISGAGGGGFFVFYCPGNVRYNLIKTLQSKYGGEFRRFTFTHFGLKKWTTSY